MRFANGILAQPSHILIGQILHVIEKDILLMVLPLVPNNDEINSKELNLARKKWAKSDLSLNNFNILFIASNEGSKGTYDFDIMIKAAKQLNNNEVNIKFIICGNASYLKKRISDNNNFIFTGWVNKAEMIALSEKSALTIAPYNNQQNYTKNITNKIYDSLYLGLPIITSLQGETEKLINSTNTGKIYEQGSVNSLCDTINYFYLDKNKLKNYQGNVEAIS